MPRARPIPTGNQYTLERLGELRREAALNGDKQSADALTDKIKAAGGTVRTSEVPENETVLQRYERLREDARDARDQQTVVALSKRIADEKERIAAVPKTASEEAAAKTKQDDGERKLNSGRATPDAQTMIEKLGFERANIRVPEGGKIRVKDVRNHEDRVKAAQAHAGEAAEAAEAGWDDGVINSGEATDDALAMIGGLGFELADIIVPDGGKVSLSDVRNHEDRLNAAESVQDETDDESDQIGVDEESDDHPGGEPVNSGNATEPAEKMIKELGYDIRDIPSASGGKVIKPDVVAYQASIAE